MSNIAKKICIVGDFGVGKTSLIRRFVERQFSDRYLSSVGVKIYRKVVEVNGKNHQEELTVQLVIWDLEGSNKFKKITPTYLQGASAVIIVGDVNRQETLVHIAEHINIFLSINPTGLIVVAFNKMDLTDEEKVSIIINNYQYQEQERVIAHYPTSAKTGLYIDEMFEKLANRIISGVEG
ncbi:MAG: Rab family GTPase [Heteroscytonema crispum UTEX LB 1556]